jgi:hypothetical protein
LQKRRRRLSTLFRRVLRFGIPGELTNSLPSPVTDRFVKYKGDFNCLGEGLKLGLVTT